MIVRLLLLLKSMMGERIKCTFLCIPIGKEGKEGGRGRVIHAGQAETPPGTRSTNTTVTSALALTSCLCGRKVRSGEVNK